MIKRHFVGDPKAKTLAQAETALYKAVFAKLSPSAFAVLYAWIRQFPHNFIDPRRYTCDVNHSLIAQTFALSLREYGKAVAEIKEQGFAKMTRVRSRGRVVCIDFAKLQVLADELEAPK